MATVDLEVPRYSSTSHTDDAPLVSDSLFDFMVHLRSNSDTFDPMYYDLTMILPEGVVEATARPEDIMPDEMIRNLVQQYTGEPTDLPTFES